MRVLQLISALRGGGAERQTLYLAEGLAARGHEVLVVHRHSKAATAVAALQMPDRHSFNPLQIFDVLRVIETWKPDLVQTGSVLTDVVGGLACALARVPFVVREANVAALYRRGLRMRLRDFVVRRFASAVIANSEEGAKYWKTPYVIRNGFPLEAIESAPPAPLRKPAALYVGRLDPEKNVDVVLRAVAKTDHNLYLCGQGLERDKLEALAKELGIADRTHFLGYVDNPWSYQRAADVGLLVSNIEGHPNAVGEAFAAGLPMILSDIPPHREIATEDEALFVPLRDVDATARAIREVSSDRADRAKARARDWSLDQMTSLYESAYSQILQHRLSSRRQ